MDSVTIAFICDNSYVLPTNIAIMSLVSNKNKETHYDIYVVTTSLTDESKNLLQVHNNETVTVHIIETELDELASLHKYSSKSYCVATPAALLKFRLPELLSCSKVLYLDGDIIVRDDITNLFQTDLLGYYAGAVIDSGSIYSKNPRVLKHPNYFNSGVMLLNLDEMRKDNCTQRLIKEKRLSNDSSLMDQNIFNIVFENHVKFLPLKFNCLFINLIRASDKFCLDELNNRFGTNYTSLREVAETATIIHYSSKDKPWRYSDIPLANEWYMYYLRFCNKYGLDFNQIHRTISSLGKNDRFYQERYRPNIVVSLTTFPARINVVHIPILEMMGQTVKADHIVLWLAKEQFPNLEKDLPHTLTSLIPRGLEIRWCEEDLKSHKKYFYAIQKYPDCLIITIDDDLHYSPYMIEKLLDSYKKHPTAVSAMRVHLMIRDRKNPTRIAPYSEWKKEYSSWLLTPSLQLFATSGAGTLFPPFCMSMDVFDKELIKKYCLHADDIWLKLAQIKVNTPVVLADSHQRLTYIEGTQDVALWKRNVNLGGNDLQLNQLLDVFDHCFSDPNDSIVARIFSASPRPNKQALRPENQFQLNSQIQELQDKLAKIQNSKRYKLGRILTFIPRKILGGIRCYQENGWRYTINRLKEKANNFFHR